MNPVQQNPNLEQLLAAVVQLEPLLERIVFVGGCVTGLLITDPAAAPIRPTLDVDVIVETATYADFTVLEQGLRQLGFRESREERAPICRWVSGNVILDLMPVDPSILGFSNRWYRPALENAQTIKLGEYEIRVVSAPYFLATKVEAFHGRGNNDFRMSRDLEDIVAVVDGRAEIIGEVHFAQPDLQKYLSEEFRALQSNRDFVEALPGHLLPDSSSQQRVGLVLGRMKQFLTED